MPSLLDRGALAVPPGTPAARAEIMRNSIPVNYIADIVNKTPVVGPGSRVLVLRAGTGSGKSTALPEKLYDRGRRIAITQPQRITAEEIPYEIAARNPEFRMGETIGFQTGLINRVPRRGLVFMTTGILVQQLINESDPQSIIRRYSTIIVDEVHKHDLMTDVLLSLLKQFLARFWNHPECPFVIIQSATLEPEKYMSYFETQLFVDVTGITYPIEAHWPTQAVGDLVPWIVSTCSKLQGDTLVFLPGKRPIQKVHEALERLRGTVVIEVMGETVAKGEVKQMLRASNTTRVVLATNAAETGLTLPYLANVIDAGLVNNVEYNPQFACTTVAMQPVTEASARQRRGRVGRKFAGHWYPAFTEATYNAMTKENSPEMFTADISAYLLRLIVKVTESRLDRHWLVEAQTDFDPATLDLIHRPSQEGLVGAYDKLYQLGLIEHNWRPTVTGTLASRMSKTAPETAKMLFSAPRHGADLYKLVVIAACIESGGLGDLKDFGNELHDDRIRCGFIRQLVAFEHLQRRIRKMSVRHMSTTWIAEWCESVGISYAAAMRVIERTYELMFELMGLGLRVDVDTPPLLDALEADKKATTLPEIQKIKACIMEGYRLNVCTWNEPLTSYVCAYKHARAECREPFPAGPPLNIVTNSITYVRGRTGAMTFSTGAFVCQLDEHVTIDPHFMY